MHDREPTVIHEEQNVVAAFLASERNTAVLGEYMTGADLALQLALQGRTSVEGQL